MAPTHTTISTSRFGDLDVPASQMIRFVEPIIGFDNQDQFIILEHADNSPFKWLQAVHQSDLAFVVTNPKFFGIEYEFAIPDDIAEKIGLDNAEDAVVLTIVNIPNDDPGKMTANLLGPIVINEKTKLGLQLVLGDSTYTTKTRLIPDDVLGQPNA